MALNLLDPNELINDQQQTFDINCYQIVMKKIHKRYPLDYIVQSTSTIHEDLLKQKVQQRHNKKRRLKQGKHGQVI